MKKATVKPKLELKRNTVKQLTNDQLTDVAGGTNCGPRTRVCSGSLSGCG